MNGVIVREQSAPTYSLTEMERMAAAVSKSGFFKLAPDAVLTLMLIAQAEGRHPVQAAMDYDVIQGKPRLKTEKLLARFLESGGQVEWKTRTAERCAATFRHPRGVTVDIEWTWEQATAAKLTGKDVWRAYPVQMLSWRVVADGVRASYPACASITRTAEEHETIHEDGPREEVVTIDGEVIEAAAILDPDNVRDEDGINPAERAVLQVLVRTIRTTCTDAASVDAFIAGNNGMLASLRKGAKQEVWAALKAIKEADPDADPLSEAFRYLDDLDDVDAVDSVMKSYRKGAALGGAPMWAALPPEDRDRIEEHARGVKEAIAERQLGAAA